MRVLLAPYGKVELLEEEDGTGMTTTSVTARLAGY